MEPPGSAPLIEFVLWDPSSLSRPQSGAYLIAIASIGSEKPAKEADASLTTAVLKIGRDAYSPKTPQFKLEFANLQA